MDIPKPEPQLKEINIEKGNENNRFLVEGDYYQIHGSFINLPNQSDPTTAISQIRTSIVFEIVGSLDDLNPRDLKELLRILRKVSGDGSIMMRNIQRGSIKITLEGSQEGIRRILELINSGEFNNTTGFHLIDQKKNFQKEKHQKSSRTEQQNFRSRSPHFSGQKRTFPKEKQKRVSTTNKQDFKSSETSSRRQHSLIAIVFAIVFTVLIAVFASSLVQKPRDLSGSDMSWADLNQADLSEANLSQTNLIFADLSEANLKQAYLIRSDLRGADLKGADLREANLIEANLRGANLTGADLSKADLWETNFDDAILLDAIFGNNSGLSEDDKSDFVRRGAIFQDSSDFQ